MVMAGPEKRFGSIAMELSRWWRKGRPVDTNSLGDKESPGAGLGGLK